mmetsp:Transcript_7138/g.18558  ORF Transcript_7138/g.18558 Transcript_7138/m.18558 type:complete len:292 (+) Transcript_7138:618-1493(+)
MEAGIRRHGRSLVFDTGGHLGKQGEVKNERRREQRVFARVVHHNRVGASHEDLRSVLVHRALGVGDVRHILDDDDVVGVLVFRVEDSIGANHIIDHVRLGDLLRAERLWRREVLAIVVAKVVVRDDRRRLDSRRDEEVDHDRLHLRLARFEVVSTDHHIVLLRKLDHARHESVLRRAVDVRAALQDRRDRKDGRWCHFGLVALDGGHQVVSRVVDTRLHRRETLRVRRPEHNHRVKPVCHLEVADVLADLLKVCHLALTEDHIVRAGLLVGSDEVGVVDRRQRRHVLHVWA